MLSKHPICTPVLGQTKYIVLPKILNETDLDFIAQDIQKNLNSKAKIRIVLENQTQEVAITKLLHNLKLKQPNLDFSDYPTRFYQVMQANIAEIYSQNIVENWSKFQDEFTITKINSPKDELYPTLLDFCQFSNGVDFSKDENGKTLMIPNLKSQENIKNQLPLALSYNTNHVYLVHGKDGKNFVGCFDLVEFLEELQLHYTSGKSSLEKSLIYPGKKMPILASAIYHLFTTEFSSFDKLTFTSKDDATKKIYTEVGFKEFSGRKCILVKVIS